MSPGQAQMLLPGSYTSEPNGTAARRPWRSKHHPGVLALILQAAGPGDHVKEPLARRLRRNAARRVGE